jgi:GR25 family glycosyltransferase involved in LPS biosynthesis
MEIENWIKHFIVEGSEVDILQFIRHCRVNHLYSLGILVSELVLDFYPNHVDLLDEIAMCYYYRGLYQNSWNIYVAIFEQRVQLPQSIYDGLVFNSHFSIPHITQSYHSYPEDIIKDITSSKLLNDLPYITLTITTCRRYELFERTMNSFLHCCKDLYLISEWICIDDNSSEEDRQRMKDRYPFFTFIWKSPEQKGHAVSMNMLQKLVATPYVLHLEDDWEFFMPTNYITNCLNILATNPTYGQCLFNRNYAEVPGDVHIKGGYFQYTDSNVAYYLHQYEEESVEQFQGVRHNAYWPHYSLRPGIFRSQVWRELGEYNPNSDHFEMEYAYRYFRQYKTVFLPYLTCRHIGRLTTERHLEKDNAYTLNNQPQFSKVKVDCKVINLKRRPDRLEKISKLITFPFEVVEAVDGRKLSLNFYIEQLFKHNNFNYRSGIVGCALSHMLVWETITNPTLILEDDVILSDGFTNALSKLNLAFDWDVIFLGYSQKLGLTLDDKGFQLLKVDVQGARRISLGGTFGYLVSPKGAKRLLDYMRTQGIIHAIDTMMQLSADALDIYYLVPPIVYSDCYENNEHVDSDVQFEFHSLTRTVNEKLQELYQLYPNYDLCIEYRKIKHATNPVICFSNCCLEEGFAYRISDDVVLWLPVESDQRAISEII